MMVRLPRIGLRVAGRLVLGIVASAVLTTPPLFAQQVEAFVGEIRWVAFNFAPQGWALCDGQILAVSSNTALFALLGTTYGGNGVSTFALPDMRGRVPVHPGTGPGLSERLLGEEGGVESVTLTTAQIPAHSHTLASHTHSIPALAVDVKASSGAATTASPAGNALAVATLEAGGRGDGPGAPKLTNIYNASAPDVSLNAATAATAAGTTGGGSGATMSTGGSTPHDNMQPFLGLTCIIALEGTLPARN
jgi:microcystin-dependent protein